MPWLGREGSNLRMAESKSAALPLGYAPSCRRVGIRETAHDSGLAEARGFEPPVPISEYNDLANRRLKPLGHASVAESYKQVPWQYQARGQQPHSFDGRHTADTAWHARPPASVISYALRSSAAGTLPHGCGMGALARISKGGWVRSCRSTVLLPECTQTRSINPKAYGLRNPLPKEHVLH